MVKEPDFKILGILSKLAQNNVNKDVLETEIIAFCEKQLSTYKRPRCIIFDKVPRNPTGKIEKPKLRQKYGGQ